jgi:hypothetical protein
VRSDLYRNSRHMMLFGDAKDNLTTLTSEVKSMR